VSLEVSQRQGVEIDRCPSCRGVWLDRGELDKIMSRYDRFDDDDDRYRDRREYREHHHPRRKSFWQELFD
jgi:Zn-finger nucleic acid-binding protein